MGPFECYTYKEAIGHETGFTRIQPQEYSRLNNNLQWVGNLIYNYNLEFKRGQSQTAKIDEPNQGGKYSLKFVMICCAEEVKLGDRKESSSRRLIRSHEGGVTKPFKNTITCHNERMDAKKKRPGLPILLVYYLLFYHLWTLGSASCANAAKGE